MTARDAIERMSMQVCATANKYPTPTVFVCAVQPFKISVTTQTDPRSFGEEGGREEEGREEGATDVIQLVHVLWTRKL